MTPGTERETAGGHAPRHDWSARARTTALEALRYTQFVGVMKRALLVAAFAVIAAVLAYFVVARQPGRIAAGYEQMTRVENDLAMVKPRLSGQDIKGNPFVITADTAIQDAKNPKRARLIKVAADMSQGADGWINADAANGVVDMKAGSLELNGGINVFSEQGYELHTASAFFDLNRGVLQGREEVTGQGPSGSFRADQFQFDRNSKILTLTGRVSMTIVGTRS